MKLFFLFPFMFLLTWFSEPSVVEWQTEREYDFGDILRDKTVSVDFLFKNLTTQPITVDVVRTTCGCTASEWSDIPTLPGETGKIHIEFDARRTGYFHKKIRVFFSGQRKVEMLGIEGFVLE